VPYTLFVSGRDEDKIVFEKLVKSYSSARYRTDFMIEESEISLLIDKVSELVKFGIMDQ
jgi:hypothetical protein